MEKKNKKKLFAIIGASALAFVLTIALSVSITLAYFGDLASANKEISMGAKLEFDDTATKVETSVATTGALPGDAIKVTITATIDQTSTQGYIRMKLTPSVADDAAITTGDFTMGNISVSGVTGSFVKHSTDGYYYLVSSGTDDTATMLAVDATDGDVTLTIGFDYTVSTALTNDVAGQKITLTADFGTVQSANIGTTVSDVSAVFADTNTNPID